MTDRYERIRKALADMDAAAEARNALAWRDAHDRFVVHVAPDTIRALIAERDQLAAALEAAREDAERYRWLKDNDNAFLLSEDVIDDQIAIDQARGKGVAGG